MPDSAVTVNAVFNKIDYTITYPETEKGTVTGVQTANYGDEVTLTVTPDDHCQLDSLSVKDGDNNEITVTDGKFIMPASDVTVSASFVNTRYEVTYLPAENGTVTGETLVSHGDEVAVTVTPETGYSLDTLIVTDGSGNEVAVNDNKFIMPESNATVEAIFVKTDHAITYAETANGTVTGAASANYGEEVELTVTPDKDYTVDTITVTDEQGNSIEVSNNSFIMPNSPVTVSVLFVRCYAYAVFDGNSKTLTFKYGTHVPEGGYTEWEIPSGDTVPWINYNSKYITTVVFDPTFAEARPTTTANWFYNFDALTDIQGIEYLNTSEVTNMSGMFYYCDSLVSLDLSSLDTSSVTNMSNMFYSCQNLISLDLSNFDTSNVTDMSQMFYYCLDLTTLDLSFFDTSKSPNTKNMFLDCGKLETIYVEGIDTQWQSSNDYDMFNRCYSIVGGTGRTYVNYATSISMAKADNGYFTAKTHSVTIGTVTGGTVEADVTQAAMNQTVTLTATPDDAEMIPDYTVTDENGNEIEVTNNQFRMPASDVTVSASFRYITFTVQWVVGGIVVETDEAIKDRTPEFNGEVAQEYSDGVKNYIFCGWNDGTNTYAADELPAVTADVTYTAAYTEADYDFDEPVWNWADDRSTATATFTWTYNDREYSKTVNALISFNESETHPQYTATVIFKGKEYTNTVGVYRSASINFATAGKTATVSGIVGEAVQFEPGNYSYWKDNADFATSTVRAKSSSGADISLDVTFDNETGKFSFVMPNDDISITIYYNKYREVPSGSFEHGTATPDKARACAGEVVTYTTDVDGGWKIDEIHLSYRSGSGSTHLADAVQDEHNRNIWYLTMPADRNVYEGLFATFSEDANWHTITIEEAANGTVSHAKGGADTGDEVTLTVTPNDFYVLDSISVKDADENEIAVTNGKFTMPASDVTVTASFVAASVMVSGGTNTAYFATLDEALASWTQGTTLTLISDISISSRIEVSESKTLDLNGYTLRRTGGSGTEGQVIFVSSGPLTVNDSSGDNSGVITGGNANNGGGINIGANGRLDMNGGTITGNTGSTRAGGISCRGTFTMNGGVITNNTSANGGGVAIWEGGTFNMNGGVITNNTSANGGGIDLINGTLNLQGNPQVIGNKKPNNEQSNILLSENQTVSISDELTEGASIGVSTAVAPTLAAPVVIQNAGEADSLGYFSSDNDAYYIGLDDSGNIVLRVNMTFTAVSAADATCVDDGYTQNCWLGEDDNYYADANGITQLNTSDVVIPATGVHSYGEPEWTWAQDYSTASATFTCSVGGESTTVDATITSEVKNGKRVYTCTIEFEGDTYTDTKEEDIIVPANDIYNLTVEENIDVNILIDVSGHEANGEEIEKIVYTYPDVTTQTRNTLTETVNAEDITTDANGYFVKSFTMAIAQVNEPIKAVIYFTNGTSKEIKVSVAGYCKYIIENASANGYSDKLVNLCYTALEYGKNAINYFGYEYPSDITYPEYTLPNEFNATPEITSQAGIRKGDTVTGIASTQMFIISNATMRLTFKDDMSSLNIESVKVGDRDLTAEIVKTSDNRWSVDISGIYATELSKAVELTLSDGTYVKYAATDWAKSILNYSTNENSKALAKSLYYYSEAANEYFGG